MAMMILSDVFERFADTCPLPVMAQAILENALNPRVVDQLFEDVSEHQYTRKLLFSSIVDLMSLVVCRIRPAIHAAYQAHAEILDASLRAVYGKIDRVEPGIAAALVRSTAERLEPVLEAMNGARPALLSGYRVKIVDGNHRAGTEHRLKELRTMRAGALPGQALVVLDPRLMLVTDVIPCEDGHAQERALLDQVLQVVHPRELWIEDRNFCTTDFLFGIAGRAAFFIVRQHASTLHWEFMGKRRACGRIDTGKVFRQTIRATNDAGEILILRRITVVLDQPTRDGDTEIHLLTNVPAQDAHARVIADLYRKRWTIETAFAELEATLEGEVNTLGYPKAALFAFCVALVSYNVLSTLKAALRSVHGEEVVAEQVSGYYVAEEVTMTHRGMMIAIPEDEWVEFQEMAPAELAGVLVKLAEAVRLPAYQKHPRGPKKPKPKKQSGAKIKHVSTAKILAGRQKCTT
jgi:IS4 transposase